MGPLETLRKPSTLLFRLQTLHLHTQDTICRCIDDPFFLDMAKGLRASKNKVNNARLRAKVFGPAEKARKERLSAKLLELASKPRPPTEDDTKMEIEGKGSIIS